MAGLALAVFIAQAAPANAAEIKVWTARAITTVLAEIAPQFTGATGHSVDVFSGLPDDFLRRANAGESFDILISGSGPVDKLGQGWQARRVDAYRHCALGHRRGSARGRTQA